MNTSSYTGEKPSQLKHIQAMSQTSEHADEIEYLREYGFNFVKPERASQNSFGGMMAHDTDIKAA